MNLNNCTPRKKSFIRCGYMKTFCLFSACLANLQIVKSPSWDCLSPNAIVSPRCAEIVEKVLFERAGAGDSRTVLTSISRYVGEEEEEDEHALTLFDLGTLFTRGKWSNLESTNDSERFPSIPVMLSFGVPVAKALFTS
jgi:hypothetical protein